MSNNIKLCSLTNSFSQHKQWLKINTECACMFMYFTINKIIQTSTGSMGRGMWDVDTVLPNIPLPSPPAIYSIHHILLSFHPSLRPHLSLAFILLFFRPIKSLHLSPNTFITNVLLMSMVIHCDLADFLQDFLNLFFLTVFGVILTLFITSFSSWFWLRQFMEKVKGKSTLLVISDLILILFIFLYL